MRLTKVVALWSIMVGTGCSEILGFGEYAVGLGIEGQGGATTNGQGGGGDGMAPGGAGGIGGSGASTASAGDGGAPGCSAENPCAEPEEPQCETIVCEDGTCAAHPEPSGKALAIQDPGDCTEIQCDGNGGTAEAPAVDPLIDNNPCVVHSCDAGSPQTAMVDAGTPCGDGVCDGSGSCVGCVDASGCPGVDDECKARTCVANTCGFQYTPNGTPVTSQTSGNCQKKQCDGSGNIKSVADNADIPADDGKQCTSETCSGGLPMHPNKAYGTSCSQGGNQCNGSGTCKYTTGYSCSTSSQCLSGFCVDGRCCGSACSGACQACSGSLTGGTNGTCGYIIAGKTDSNPLCSGTNACDEGGTCETKGCTFYVDSNYAGAALAVAAPPPSVTSLTDLHIGSWNDKLSSHICTGGAKVTLCIDTGFAGTCWTLSGSVPTYHDNTMYGNLGDRASSLKVF